MKIFLYNISFKKNGESKRQKSSAKTALEAHKIENKKKMITA